MFSSYQATITLSQCSILDQAFKATFFAGAFFSEAHDVGATFDHHRESEAAILARIKMLQQQLDNTFFGLLSPEIYRLLWD